MIEMLFSWNKHNKGLFKYLFYMDGTNVKRVVKLALKRFTVGINTLWHLRHLLAICIPQVINLTVMRSPYRYMLPNFSLRHVLNANLTALTVFYI